MRPVARRDDERIDQRRHGHAADGRRYGQRRRSPAGEMPDRELAFDFEADDEEEDGQESVVDPVAQRHREVEAAEGKSGGLLPEALEARTHAGVGDDHGNERCQQQQDAGRRPPAGEVEGGRAHAMAERAEHGIGERALVPRPVVAPAVDEEGRREHHAARPRARLVGGDAAFREARSLAAAFDILQGDAEILGDGRDVVGGERLRTAHQRDMRFPERIRISRLLDEHGGAVRQLIVSHRAVPEDVAQALADLIARLGDALVGGAAMRAGIAAVLDQRDRRLLGS